MGLKDIVTFLTLCVQSFWTTYEFCPCEKYCSTCKRCWVRVSWNSWKFAPAHLFFHLRWCKYTILSLFYFFLRLRQKFTFCFLEDIEPEGEGEDSEAASPRPRKFTPPLHPFHSSLWSSIRFNLWDRDMLL